MSILRRYINMIGASNNLNPDDVEKPINVLQFNRRVFKNSQVRIYSGLKWPDMTQPAAERIENPDESIAKIKFNGHYHTTFNGAPAFAGLAIPTRFTVKPGEKIVWRVRGKTNKKHIGLPVDVWFKQRPPVVSYQVTNLLGSYGSFSVDSNNDGVADGWTPSPNTNGVNVSITNINNTKFQYVEYLQDLPSTLWRFERIMPLDVGSGIVVNGNAKVFGKMLYYYPSSATDVHFELECVFFNSSGQNVWGTIIKSMTPRQPDTINIYYKTIIVSNVSRLYACNLFTKYDFINNSRPHGGFAKVLLVDLIGMGELPQSLKQFFAPSNIIRWDQLATTSNITAINGQVMSGNDWLNLLIPYGENTYTVQLEYDTTAETWTAKTTTTRQGSAIYNVHNLLGNTGSFSSYSGGLGTGWQLYGNYTPSISSGRQVLTLNNFTNSTGNTITHRIKQQLTNMINEHYYYFYFQASVSNPNIQTYCWIDLYDGSEPQWGVASQLVQATALTDYAGVFQVLNNNVTASVSLGVINQPTDTTYTQTFTVDNVMLVDLTAMGELPPKIREKFPTLKYWHQFATQSTITAADGSTMSGVNWLRKFLPFSDRNYTVSLVTNSPHDAAVYVQSKPSTTGKYTVTNLLGTYGSFSVDSDNDGLADGWTFRRENVSVNCTVENSIQYFEGTTSSSPLAYIYRNVSQTNNTDKYFLKTRAKVSSTGSVSSVPHLGRLYFVGLDNSNNEIWNPSNGLQFAEFALNQDFDTKYVSYTFSDTRIVSFRLNGFYVGHPSYPNGVTNKAWIDYIQLVNLSAMGELPQPLKQFFAPSNITRWDQLATSSNITAINGQVMSGNNWLNLLIPYGEGTYTVEYAILPDGQLATWVSGDEQESTYNSIVATDSTTVLNNLQYYEITNLVGNYGSFSVDSNNDGLADGWTKNGWQVEWTLINQKQKARFSGTLSVPTNFYNQLTVPTAPDKYFFATTFSGVSYHSDGLGIRILYIDFFGGTPQWVGLPFTMQQGTVYDERRYYYSFANNGTNNNLRVFPVLFEVNTYSQESYAIVDNVIAVNLTAMDELPQPLKQFFAPSNIIRWDQLATSSNITAINGRVMPGNDWLNLLIPYGEGTYKVWYSISQNNQLIVSTKPSELVNTSVLAAVKKEVMNEAIGIYEPTVEGYIDEIIISPNTDNGQAKEFELEIDSVDVFKIPANTTPITRARYTVTNLLGSYGSFSVDSNNDGVADGWTAGNTTGMTATYSLSNGQRRILDSKWLNNTGSVKVMNLSFGIDLPTNTNKFFYRNTTSITVTDTVSSNVAGFYNLKVDLVGGTTQYNAISKIKYFTQTRTYLYNEYATCSNNGTNYRAIIYTLQFYADNNQTIPAHDCTISRVIFVDLTVMGELPQPLKQFFAPSNITRWDQLATSSNITAANGRVMPGNDWLNLLIPYGEGTYTVEFSAYSNYFLTNIVQEYSQDTSSYVLRTGHELDRAQMFAYMLPALATKMRDRIVVNFSTNSCNAVHGNVYFTASSGELLYNKVNRGKNLTLTCSTATVEVLSEDSNTIRFKLTSGGSTVTTGLHIINVEEQL